MSFVFPSQSLSPSPCFLCSSPQAEPHYAKCTQPFKCGSDSTVLGELKYPFWGINRPNYCGKLGFELKCLNNTLFITDSTYSLEVIGAYPQADKIRVAIANLRHNNLCHSSVLNTNATNSSIFDLNFAGSLHLDSSNAFLTILYGCPSQLGRQLGWSSQFSCSINNTNTGVHFVTHTVNDSLTLGCLGVAILPVVQENAQALDENTITLPNALDQGFELGWFTPDDHICEACVKSGGECGYDNQFTCYCPDQPYELHCPPSKPGPKEQKILIITDIRKMTNSFREKLGEGGYGTVFKGKLQDGCHVAVKVSKESKGDGHEFANEVVSICRTSHINIVPLLGFCFEGHKRALLYEFMPNGSLEKFIRQRDFLKNDPTLPFSKLFEIAVGIARGLEYLHRGCNTRIVHFDIKPHNILLDAEFTPKISDFGLAKRFKQKDSIISISGARGTAGYIAPEVFFRSFGGASHKSDVYSYGMMVLEIVGCTKRTEENIENSSELYFPRWIYKQLERGPTLDCGRILNEEEKELERKMVLVGLWCIQTSPGSRPSMHGVLGMLQGEVELQVPPMPSLSSPPRPQQPSEDPDSATFGSSTTYAPSVVD